MKPADLELTNAHANAGSRLGFPEATWQIRETRSWLEVEGAAYCSYCGSCDPVTYLRLLERGGASRVESADWKYGWPHKVYLDVPNPNADELTYMGSTSGATAIEPVSSNYWPVEELTPEHKKILEREGIEVEDHHRGFLFGTRDLIHQKFYNVHLNDVPEGLTEGQIDLIEERTGVVWSFDDDGRLKWRGIPRGMLR